MSEPCPMCDSPSSETILDFWEYSDGLKIVLCFSCKDCDTRWITPQMAQFRDKIPGILFERFEDEKEIQR